MTQHSIPSVIYHVGLSKQERDYNELQWTTNKTKIMITTTSISIFINKTNKKDIRFIIHSTITSSIPLYYNECFEAGLDGAISRCILYFDHHDRFLVQFLIRNARADNTEIQQRVQRLYDMVWYCQNNVDCRRVIISRSVLGEKCIREQCRMDINTLDWCTHKKLVKNNTIWHGCDNCNDGSLDGSYYEKIDVTLFAFDICNIVKKLMNFSMRIKAYVVAEIFRGSKTQKVSSV
eukprot:UN09635